ncbi:MAG TPA: M1 family aminopeptidase [Thermoanaerobaculia bacterium]|nr:M1 family aminopeptidase [Thermoanaerobaculia bacterium]
MFRAIAAFELKYHLKSPLFYILLIVFSLITFGGTTSDSVTLGGAVGNINRNAPFVIMQFLMVMSVFGVLSTTAFVASAVHRDFELGTDGLFFSSPVRKWQYLGGRFVGSFIVATLIYLGVIAGIILGSLMPWIDKARLGPFDFYPYFYSLFVMVVPNLLLAGAIFFAIAALTRSLMATYAGAVFFIVASAVSSSMLEDMENEAIAALLDPFGFAAFQISTRYWTVFQRNTQVLPLEGVYLWNRILWTAVALLILGFAVWRFKFTTGTRKTRKKAGKRNTKLVEELQPIQRITLTLPKPAQTFGGMASVRQFLARVKLEAAMIFKSIPFVIMLSLGVLNIWGNSTAFGNMFGTAIYPVTGIMINVIQGAFGLFALLITAFYAGDIVWRERTIKLDQVSDAMPLPTWAQWAAKLTALFFVILATLASAVVTGIVIQAARGYFNFELGVYAKGMFVELLPFLLFIATFSFVVQVLFNQKFVGFLAVLVYFILGNALPAMDFEHLLYRFASQPQSTWSDMNGYGHFMKSILVFNLYWALFCLALLAIAHLLWVRGTESGFRQRLRIARQRFGKPVAAALALSLIAFAGTGCYIYYNTNVLNEYRTTNQEEERRANAEKKYKKFQEILQPKVTDVQADVDIYPERRAIDIRGVYTLRNKTPKPIAELHVTHNPMTLRHLKLEIPGARVKSDDRTHGYAIYTLAQPLAPGATTTMKFRGGFAAKGFPNGATNTNIVANGTFFNSISYFPQIGYNSEDELQDRNERRKHGLQPIQRMKKPDDMQARMSNGLASDWMNLDTTVSTSPDQLALAPGYLQKEWTQNGRRYFHYKTTAPILGLWSYLSAKYTVKRDSWTSPKGEKIPIEIYYDAKHAYNVDRMIDATKKSLDYFTANFSPYQHKQVRILEFPGYARFAQSFPNTIPFSESIGFIADLRDKEEIDYVFYITAHEVAHQWWAHQVIGGNVQGSTMLVETMAQYSALMVMEKEYGREKMQKFLRYELDRYLAGRGGELVAEMPLVLVENQQYIHYRKGSLVTYALRDYIGEAAVNRALAKFIRDKAFQEPPYTTATELVQYLRSEAPPEHQETITDLFERIVLYDLQAREVSATKRPDGKYAVKIRVTTAKLRGDAQGEEKPVPINDLVDIGVLGEKDKVLFTEKRRITKPEETFEVIVNGEPKKAGIDPFNKLIDRNPKDNVKSL